jgi:hypothetical protein
MTQGELFPDPQVPKPRMATGSKAARYARRRPDSAWCDDCIRAVHVRGLAYADPVRKATWLRVTAAGSLRLCEIHKNERMGDER